MDFFFLRNGVNIHYYFNSQRLVSNTNTVLLLHYVLSIGSYLSLNLDHRICFNIETHVSKTA